jgi:hypothetical protein
VAEANRLREAFLRIQEQCWRRQLTLWLRDQDHPISYPYCYVFRSGVPEFLNVIRPGPGLIGMYRSSDIRQMTETPVPRRSDDLTGMAAVPRRADYEFAVTVSVMDRLEPFSYRRAYASFHHGDDGPEWAIIHEPKEVLSVFSSRILRRLTQSIVSIRPPAPPPSMKGWRRRHCWHQDVSLSLSTGSQLKLSDVYVVCGQGGIGIWRHRPRRRNDHRLYDFAYEEVEMLLSKPGSPIQAPAPRELRPEPESGICST